MTAETYTKMNNVLIRSCILVGRVYSFRYCRVRLSLSSLSISVKLKQVFIIGAILHCAQFVAMGFPSTRYT